jgi:protein kinase-like protein
VSPCSSCSGRVPEEARFCPACGAPAAGSFTPTRLDAVHTTPGKGAAAGVAGRFVPGSMLAGRYRIVGLLGRGGMGEVYRADDLRLGQPVALKFLPESLGRDPGRLERFHAEVRLARQVSHPNVCRVYDIGEAEGHPFLSMEFVDGEDLESLLRRIGRLPRDKAIQFARQLCAGLSAAHDAGVLHRDLKPANVMIDGRGRARITDFGLAAIAGDVRGAEVRAGTPDYMSPEQLAGQDVTVRSDLYSLGLVLYETFTGRSPFERGDTPAGVVRIRASSTAKSPSSVLAGIDPAVERSILRCLETDPQRRPASALAVAAALPGGDPLAAALAAGETPSPEMVAAAGEEGALTPRIAWACLLGTALGMASFVVMSHPLNLVNRVPMDKRPEVLVDRARDVLRRLGHDAPARDSAFQFEDQTDYLHYLRDHDAGPRRWDPLASGRPAGVFFWYRQSPESFVAHGPMSVVYRHDPPQTVPGMTIVRLDTQGRLIGFEAVPPESESAAPTALDPDWSVLFSEAGLDGSAWKPAQPSRVPRVFCDRRMAWEGHFSEAPAVPIRLEAGAYRGRIVSFGIVGPWTATGAVGASASSAGERFSQNVRIALQFAAMVAGVVLARRNLRLGRGDRSGALKIASYFTAVHLIVWALWVHHVPELADEWGIFGNNTGWTLFNAVLIWLFYLGLEPYVRRRWPGTIISWSRVLTGRLRDPLVGRDILIGSALGALLLTLRGLAGRLPGWLGWSPGIPEAHNLADLHGLQWLLGEVLDAHVHSLLIVMQLLFLILLLGALLRKEWLGTGAFILLISLQAMADPHPFVALPFSILCAVAFALVLKRCGVLAGAVGIYWFFLADTMPLTTDLTSWYAAPTLLTLLVTGGLALYGFRVALAGRPAFRLVAEEAV